MASIFGKTKFLENYYKEIPCGLKISSKSLCLARFAIFCEKFENLKWLLFLARQNCFLHWDGYSTKISCGSKILSQSLYLAWLLRYKRFCVLPILRKIPELPTLNSWSYKENKMRSRRSLISSHIQTLMSLLSRYWFYHCIVNIQQFFFYFPGQSSDEKSGLTRPLPRCVSPTLSIKGEEIPFRDIHNFSFSAKIQDGRQKW